MQLCGVDYIEIKPKEKQMNMRKVLFLSFAGFILSSAYVVSENMIPEEYQSMVLSKEAEDVHRRGMWGKVYAVTHSVEGVTVKVYVDPSVYEATEVGEFQKISLSPLMLSAKVSISGYFYDAIPMFIFSGIFLFSFIRLYKEK